MKKKIVLISSSGGHFEELLMLKPLGLTHKIFWITERTMYRPKADYFLIQTGSKDLLFPFKMFLNFFISLYIFIKIWPDFIITTGAMIVIPMSLIAKIFKKKLITIESFAKVKDGTRTGKFLYKYSDLFIIQWNELKDYYPNSVYGGSIF
jgi:UDP-N-acetylglucosamine:LPS N-acetylglucosamine transferase